ncbi:hypothetical protein Anas_08794 [Armadillidium nasatum]|uniref:Uncharacterized protein n=1 Tax=Armadillidium nasatum TaxID=96803 RepID=A0A5N5SN72_9CRUS|nr:hypothetical protein Anas_08794 [Armadillidium nasatum]
MLCLNGLTLVQILRKVYPFFSAEVAESVVESNKKKLANIPWFRRERFQSSDSSEFSDGLDLISTDSEEDRGSNRRDKSFFFVISIILNVLA